MSLSTSLSGHSAVRFREQALYRPRHVVLVADPSLPASATLAQNLQAGGFSGSLALLQAVAGIAGLPQVPDLAVLSLPPEQLEPAMAALSARGCHAAVVPGVAADLAGIARRTGVRVLGQGSFGICVPGIGLNASLSHLAPRKGRLALVGQSSALARAVLDWAEAEAVGFSHVIGIGENDDLGFAHALDWLSRDPGTGAILLELRRIKNRRMFISAARAAARMRPVVAIRAGGRLADPSGTAEAVMDAALRRAGVLRVAGLDDLLSAAETLARVKLVPGAGGPTPGGGIALVANATGLGLLAADAVLAGGARLAELPQEALQALAIGLRPGWHGTNPLVLGPGAATALGEAASMLAGLRQAEAVVALHAPVAGEDTATTAAALSAAAKATRAAPILVCWAGQATAGAQRAALAAAGLAVFPTPEAAVRGALHLLHDRQNRAAAAELPGRQVLALQPDRAAVAAILARTRAEGRLSLTEDAALAVLAAYGLPVVPGRVAADAAAAEAAAVELGFPVVLKLRSPDIARKTEIGGVALGLRSPLAVREAAEAMAERAARDRPAARLDGFLVQRQATHVQELRMRLGEDAMFGPFLGFGLGGTAADLLGDEGFDLPPLNHALAQGLIGRTRAGPLLAGYRDHPPVDLDAVAGALMRLSQIAVDFPEIASIGVNPLFADAAGVMAADASCLLRPGGQRALLAVPPYPEEWAAPWQARSGEVLMVRPIRPEDAEAHAEMFRRLAPEDVRWRFFSQIRELPAVQIARLTQIDYDREMAFVAMRRRPDGAEDMLGVSRLIREADGMTAEFAVVVDRAMKGQGLGRHLMQRLFDWAAETGIREVVGQVLADNAPMLAFIRALGFATRRSPEDEDVVEARRSVPPAG
ncbi:bifunctional acetate--CoA ligase family protein/GNAT family N-acetyltransferase [Falsiroseomonas tokyonensis]|uniref:GNAT family N-acetyltransferase n=1 Tax=Falsiroseomonas tokyonensis TaxID=430521 RepID=A0ABV7C1H7_9PROT|nr:GNAT family N-acetyltransferase [Falsiroseomonas tokyonensis]MBU8540330.1 GNAT family N-acetyltransferase [Falsiroseomonas tokyonensis]